MMHEFQAIKKLTESKEDKMRKLQTNLGKTRNENELLRKENDSKTNTIRPTLIDQYYSDVLDKSSSTRSFLDLNTSPPSKPALVGTLVTLTTMKARPLEFSGDTQTIDLVKVRPTTRFSKDVQSFDLSWSSTENIEHAFFAECYMKFDTDPSFCINGSVEINSTVVTLPGHFRHVPQYSKKYDRSSERCFLRKRAVNVFLQLQIRI
jgi:hypothetical protein